MVKKSRRCKSRTRRARYTRKRYGGGVETAKTYFYRNIKTKYSNIVDDAFLRSRPGVVFPPLEDVQKHDDKQIETEFKSIETEFKSMLDEIIRITDNKDLIDFVMQLYLTGSMGVPNSMENIGRLLDSAKKFKVLKENGENDGKQLSLKDFPSLSALEKFIEEKQDALQQIEEKKLKQSKKSALQKKLREEGEHDVEVVLETPNYIVYRPTTEAGSKFYGRNTQWCTAAEKHNHNMFCNYNSHGNLYIIQSKRNPLDKTQFHPNTMQFMNPRDEKVSEEKIDRLLEDERLKRWFKDVITGTGSLFAGVSDYLVFAKYREKNKHDMLINIDLFNALFNLGEMPSEMEKIKKKLLKNDAAFAGIARLLSTDDLDHMFKDAKFKTEFMKLKDMHENTPWFFWSKFRKYYPDYFDDEETMFATLTTPYRPGEHFEIVSDRLKRDLNFAKRLVSATYEEDDDATKHCSHALRYLLKEEEQRELIELCDEIERQQEEEGKSNKFQPSPPGNLFI